MGSPVGISPPEIFRALLKCKEIYDAFCSKYASASAKTTAFRDELLRVEKALGFQKAIEAQTGRIFDGEAAFRRTLEECQAHIEATSREALLIKNPRKLDSLRKAFATIQSTFETDLTRLQDKLVGHRQELIDYKVTLLLELAISPFDRNRSDTSSLRNALSQDVLRLKEEISELGNIVASYRRLVKENAVQKSEDQAEQLKLEAIANADPIRARLHAQFFTTVGSIYRQEDDRLPGYRPPLISLDDLSSRLSRSGKQGEGKALVESKAERMIFPRPVEIRITIKPNSPKPIEKVADSYIFIGRRFIFHKHRQPVWEHRVGPDCHPYTYHESMNLQGRIEFWEEQDVSLLPSSRKSTQANDKFEVRYQIDDNEAYMRFQSDLKGHHLLHEFNYKILRSKDSNGDNHSDNERVKLWQRTGEQMSLILSSSVQFRNKKNLDHDWPLHWLDRFEVDGHPNVVRFVFIHPPECLWSKRDEKVRKRLRHSEPSLSGKCSCKSSANSSSSSSVYSSDSGPTSKLYAQPSWREKVVYLDFEFEHEERKKDFVQQIEAARVVGSPVSPRPTMQQSPRQIAELPGSSSSPPVGVNEMSSSTPATELAVQSSPTESRNDSVFTTADRGISPRDSPIFLTKREGKQRVVDISPELLPKAARTPSLETQGAHIDPLEEFFEGPSLPAKSVSAVQKHDPNQLRLDFEDNSSCEKKVAQPGEFLGIDRKHFAGDSFS